MINKIINSEGQQYEPETISELVFDAKPIVNSFNAITSDAVARAVAGASGEVPAVTESDNGKVLKAVYDEGGPAVEWGEAAPAVTVDQTYNASSANAQSGTAVAEAIAAIPAPTVDQRFNADSINAQSGRAVAEALYRYRSVTTTQASQTEVDIDVKGDAPIKLVAENYGSEAGPSVAATFKVAQVRTGIAPNGIEVIFDLPAPQHLPINAQLTINADISGSDPNMYQLERDSYFAIAENDTLLLNGQYSLMSFRTTDTEQHTFLAGTYDVSITSGNPYLEFSQVGVTFNGAGAPGAWDEIRDYIIANASTLFSLSIPSTVKTARLLPGSTSNDADKVLTVNASGKPEWATETVELPSYTSADAGKVLQVQNDGTLAWVTLS